MKEVPIIKKPVNSIAGKSTDWLLYNKYLCHERVNGESHFLVDNLLKTLFIGNNSLYFFEVELVPKYFLVEE